MTRLFSTIGRFRLFLQAGCLLATLSPAIAPAQTPLGWINSYNETAYTTPRGELEISLAGLAVNDTIDFLNVRDDLIVSNRRLSGDSGDLTGGRVGVYYGLFDYLSVFATHQQHDLTIDLGEISSISLVDIDSALQTRQTTVGLKWTLYEADLLAPNNERTALTLELAAFESESDDFDVVIDEIRLSNLEIFFRDPQTFSVDRLEDDGWNVRLRYTWSLGALGIGTLWAGYGESEATSGTTSDLTSQTLARFFEQEFHLEEDYLYLGASLNFRLSPRLPVTINYEYIDVSRSNFTQNPQDPPDFLPGFLTAANQSRESGNHTLTARASWWLTPRAHISLLGNLYSNQFLGEIPHYNNPLSGSFSSLPYGFIGVELGVNLNF